MNICITGSGPVAIALTLFLRRQGVPPERIFLDTIQADLPAAIAARSLALSQGSVQLLGRLGKLPPGAMIEKVDIGVLGHGLHTLLNPADIGQQALGRVVRYRDLWACLNQALEAEQEICQHRFKPTNLAPEDDSTGIARLRIIADGKPEACASRLDFDQQALTCEVVAPLNAALPAPGVAYERFKPDGPLALLPLPEAGRLSLVWCMKPASASELGDAPACQFEAALSAALGTRFAPLTLASERFVSPLQRVNQQTGDHRTELRLGNAAQTLHPVAGQGMNLGLRDAFETAALIGSASAAGSGVAQLVRAALKQRQPDRQSTLSLTDSLARLDTRPVLAGLNNASTQSMAIGLLDAIGPLRKSVAKRFVFGRRSAN